MARNRSLGKKKSYRKKNWLLHFVIMFFIALTILAITTFHYVNTHFREGTFIQGVDCSQLTIEQARKKIEEEMQNQKITFKFLKAEYTATYGQFDVTLNGTEALEEIMQNQYSNPQVEYFLTDKNVDEEKVISYLSAIPELKEENMTKPQNAFLELRGEKMVIVPEVEGHWIEFDEACDFVINFLKESGNPNHTLDMERLMYCLPDVRSNNTEIVRQQQEINRILNTTINFQLADGSIYTLDSNTMKDWVVEKDGVYSVDIEGNLPTFIENLKNAINNANEYIRFYATGVGYVQVPSMEAKTPILDEEKQEEWIISQLGNNKVIDTKPIYSRSPVNEQLSSWVEVDITRQKVFMYVDGECILETDCVTGTDGLHSTPTGVFFLNNKVTDTILTDNKTYASWVMYWMPFYRGYGFHDANWRDEFGGSIYKTSGSHGCINLPHDAAEIMFQNINYDMPIFIYES